MRRDAHLSIAAKTKKINSNSHLMEREGSRRDRGGTGEGRCHRDRSRDRSSRYCSRQRSASPRGEGGPSVRADTEKKIMKHVLSKPCTLRLGVLGPPRHCASERPISTRRQRRC